MGGPGSTTCSCTAATGPIRWLSWPGRWSGRGSPVSLLEPARYDPMRCLPVEMAERVEALEPLGRAALAEQLAGNMKTHIVYAARPGEGAQAQANRAEAVPHLKGVAAAALARHVAAKGGISTDTDGLDYAIDLPRSSAPLIGAIGGRTLGDIAKVAGLDWLAFGAAWWPVHRGPTGFNLLHYSQGARR